MRICKEHWDKLRKALAEKGLDKFVSNNGEQAATKAAFKLKGEDAKTCYDPLLAANFAIWNNAVERGGLYLLTSKQDGSEYCPLCELDAHTPDKERMNSTLWIAHAADDQEHLARELGLIPPVQ